MATELRSAAKAPGKPQYESFVEQQLGKVRQRLRLVDLAGSLAILLSAVAGYGLVMGLIDRLWDLPTAVRLVCWIFLAIGLATFVGTVVIRLCFRQVNPVFLASRLEQTLPDAKNSVINWLNLREQPLPPVIRGSLGRRAAKDLTKADPEEAISLRPLWWLGSIAAVLIVLQVGLLIAGREQALSLLQRTFLPFEKKPIANRTELTLLQPAGGDIALPSNQSLTLRVKVAGYVPSLNQPDSLKLHFRYGQGEPFEERALTQDLDGSWAAVIVADQVRNGFYYKVTGGDARLPEDREFRVDVLAIAQVQRFEVEHQYRPYLVLPDKKVVYEKNMRPSFLEMRGTKTTLVVRANRDLKQCVLELKSGATKKDLLGEAVPGDPTAWQFSWVLDQSGEFRILFKSKDGEENVDRQPCKIEVIPDRPPEVEITKPAADVTLPANGTLMVEGAATDDFGVKSLQLQLRTLNVQNAPVLKPQVYRPGTSFQFTNKKYPLEVDYNDLIALEKPQTVKGEPFLLKAGMELEYWLEARDNCDYPDAAGNLGQSKRYKITIADPQNSDKASQERKNLEAKNKERTQKQDKNLAEQNLTQGGAGQGDQDPDQNAKAQQKQQNLDETAKKVQEEIQKENKKGDAKDQGPPNGGASDGSSKEGPKNGDNGGDSKTGQGGDAGQAGSEKDGGKQGDQAGDARGQGQSQQQQSNQTGAAKDGPQAGSSEPPGSQRDDGASQSKPGTEKSGPPDAQKDGVGGSKEKKVGESGGSAKDASTAGGGAAQGGEKGAGQGMSDGAAGSAKGQPPEAAPDTKGAAKAGSGTESGQTRPNTEAGNPAGAGQEKGAGAQDTAKSEQPAPGQTKGPASNSGPATKKPPEPGESNARGPAEGDPKDMGASKLPPPDGQKSAGDSKAGDRKNTSMGEVAELAKQLEDPGQREQAKKALEKISDQAVDPKVAKAADEALQKQEAQRGTLKDGKTGAINAPESNGKGNPNDPKDGGNAKTAKNDGNGQQKAGAGKSGENPGQSKQSGTGTAGPNNRGKVGAEDDGPANPFDQKAARQANDLQLETLKKKIDKLRQQLTPPVLQKLNWTEKDREEFLSQLLADAVAREQRQKMAGADNQPAPASIQALMPGTGPRAIPRETGGSGPPPAGVAEPPPQVREANKIFQNK
jgi:hypothetical protein